MNENAKEDLVKFKGKNRKIAGFGMRMNNICGLWPAYLGSMGPFMVTIDSKDDGQIRVHVSAYSRKPSKGIGTLICGVGEFDKADKFVLNSVKDFMDKAVSQISTKEG
jgi:hypothetical protein